jgi:hypothetical protein
MRFVYRAAISVGGFAVLILILEVFGLSPPTPLTKNIGPSADIYVKINASNGQLVGKPNTDKRYLDVGADNTTKSIFITYIRYDLSGIQKSNPLNTFTYSAVLRLLGSTPIPDTASIVNNYAITAAKADCNKKDWKENEWTQSICPLNAVDNSTESSILIAGKSIPNFYNWSVTSGLEKALESGQATFRLTGYPLNPTAQTVGVQFWSKDLAKYSGYFYGGSTDILVITTSAAPSFLSNVIIIIGALATAFLAFFPRVQKTGNQ